MRRGRGGGGGGSKGCLNNVKKCTIVTCHIKQTKCFKPTPTQPFVFVFCLLLFFELFTYLPLCLFAIWATCHHNYENFVKNIMAAYNVLPLVHMFYVWIVCCFVCWIYIKIVKISWFAFCIKIMRICCSKDVMAAEMTFHGATFTSENRW